MRRPATITHLNWQALKGLALECFSSRRKANAQWTLEDLLQNAGLPDTALLRQLALRAGFQPRGEPSADEVCRVAAPTEEWVSPNAYFRPATKEGAKPATKPQTLPAEAP